MRILVVLCSLYAYASENDVSITRQYSSKWEAQGSAIIDLLSTKNNASKFMRLVKRNKGRNAVDWSSLESRCNGERFTQCLDHVSHWTTTINFHSEEDANLVMLGVWREKFCTVLHACNHRKNGRDQAIDSGKFRALVAILAATQTRVLIDSHDTNGNGRLEHSETVNELADFEKWRHNQRKRYWSFKHNLENPVINGYLNNLWYHTTLSKLSLSDLIANSVDILNLWNEVIAADFFNYD